VDDAPECDFVPNNGVWYKLSIAFPATVSVSTCNQANFDTQIAIYSGGCESLVCEAGADNSNGCEKTTRVVDDVDSQDIYIVVNGVEGATGNFDLTVSVAALVIAPPVSCSWSVGHILE